MPALAQPIPIHRSFSTSSTLRELNRSPPEPPAAEEAALKSDTQAPTFLGTTKRLPEFNLVDRVVCVSGAGRGLGLVQAEALLEAGATGVNRFAQTDENMTG
jgi:hypothetical protein